MKIRIDLDETIREEELIIKCPKLTAEIQQIERVISDMLGKVQDFILYKEHYFYKCSAICRNSERSICIEKLLQSIKI